MSAATDPLVWEVAATSLVASLANGIVLIIKAVRDRNVNTAISTDITKLAGRPGVTPVDELETPRLVTPNGPTGRAPVAGVDTPPGGPPG